jgi:hypothetical protein
VSRDATRSFIRLLHLGALQNAKREPRFNERPAGSRVSSPWLRRLGWHLLRFRRIFGGVDTYPHGQVLTLVGVTRITGRLVLLSEQIIKSCKPNQTSAQAGRKHSAR